VTPLSLFLVSNMQPNAVLIQQPNIDFHTFLALSHEVLGRSPAASSDASIRDLSDAERFLSCLASLRDLQPPAGFSPHLLAHASFGVFLVAEDRDLLAILECAAMPFVSAETILRGVLAAVVTGTLAQWRVAVAAGSALRADPAVRYCFNVIHGLFCGVGLNVWGDYRDRPAPDQTFYLEYKPNG